MDVRGGMRGTYRSRKRGDPIGGSVQMPSHLPIGTGKQGTAAFLRRNHHRVIHFQHLVGVHTYTPEAESTYIMQPREFNGKANQHLRPTDRPTMSSMPAIKNCSSSIDLYGRTLQCWALRSQIRSWSCSVTNVARNTLFSDIVRMTS